MEEYFTLFPVLENGFIDYWIHPMLKPFLDLVFGLTGLASFAMLIFSFRFTHHKVSNRKLKLITAIGLVVSVCFVWCRPATVYPEGFYKVSYQRNGIGQERFCLQRVVTDFSQPTINKHSWGNVECDTAKSVIYEKYRMAEVKRVDIYRKRIERRLRELAQSRKSELKEFEEVNDNL